MAKRLPTFLALAGWLLGGAAVWTAFERSAAAAGWHADQEAGVRLPLPFDDAEKKTGEQVTNLILEQPRARIPEGIKYTSGLYAKAGVPFVLIWTRQEAGQPSRAAIDAQALDRDQLDRIIEGRADVAAGDLRSRVLVRLVRGQSVFLGLYYTDPKDGALLDQIRATLEVVPERALTYDELPSDGPSPILVTVVAGLAFAGGVVLWLRRRALADAWAARRGS